MMEKYNINQTTLKILGLYRNDYRRALHLREISRETTVDVKATQLQLKRLENINVLTSVQRGRNKEYHLNLSNPISKYHLILAETFASIIYLTNNFLVKKIVGEFLDQIEGTVLLFGSFAKGEATRRSDLDLFVVIEEKLGAKVMGSVEEAGSMVGRGISLKMADTRRFLAGLDEADPLVREVVSSHVVLKGVDSFCDTMWRHYARP